MSHQPYNSSAMRNCCFHQVGAEVLEVACAECSLDPMCIVLEYGEGQEALPKKMLMRRRPISRGETLFRMGDPFHSIFAVKSGSLKTYVPKANRADQVVGFHLPGELIGTEGLAGKIYPNTARALEDSSVCQLRLVPWPPSEYRREAIQEAIISLLGWEVAFNHELIKSLVHQSADQRVAGFLLSLSTRLASHGLPKSEFRMAMSRSDIGNYLGLASETVSRILTRFQDAGFVAMHHKQLRLLDPASLGAIVET